MALRSIISEIGQGFPVFALLLTIFPESRLTPYTCYMLLTGQEILRALNYLLGCLHDACASSQSRDVKMWHSQRMPSREGLDSFHCMIDDTVAQFGLSSPWSGSPSMGSRMATKGISDIGCHRFRVYALAFAINRSARLRFSKVDRLAPLEW
jgi:hypothetical protein